MSEIVRKNHSSSTPYPKKRTTYPARARAANVSATLRLPLTRSHPTHLPPNPIHLLTAITAEAQVLDAVFPWALASASSLPLLLLSQLPWQ